MGVCCRYALSIVIPARLRDSSYSRGRDFNSFAISLASLPGRTGKVNAIRDILVPPSESYAKGDRTVSLLDRHAGRDRPVCGCLLYTSDAADDLLCVDLGGRRINKKKKTKEKKKKKK